MCITKYQDLIGESNVKLNNKRSEGGTEKGNTLPLILFCNSSI